jgi:hypothetical protein
LADRCFLRLSIKAGAILTELLLQDLINESVLRVIFAVDFPVTCCPTLRASITATPTPASLSARAVVANDSAADDGNVDADLSR